MSFIFETLQKIQYELRRYGSGIALYHGKPTEVFKKITSDYNVQNVITNRDYEPDAKKREEAVKDFLSEKDIGVFTFKDQDIFERNGIVKADGNLYLVYTPYMKAWKNTFRKEYDEKVYSTKESLSKFAISKYISKRNFPEEDATSHLRRICVLER